MKSFRIICFFNYQTSFLLYGLSTIMLLNSCVSKPIVIPRRESIAVSTIKIPLQSKEQKYSNAQEVVYTLEHAIEQALLNNPRLQALYARFEQLSLQTPQVTSLPDPKLSYSQFVEGVQTRTGEQEFIIGMNQTFPWFGELELRGQITDAKALQLLEEYRIAMLDIREQVSITIYQLVYQQEALELTIEDKNTLEQSLEAVTSLYTTGQRGREALLKTQTELALIENELVAIPAKVAVLKSEIANLLHIDHPVEINESFSQDYPLPPAIDLKALIEIAEQSRPELSHLLLAKDIATLEHGLAKKDDYPDVTLGINYIGIGESPSNPSDEGEDAWNIAMSFNIPIPNARRKAAKEMAKTKAVEVDFKLQSQVNQIKTELTSSLAEFQSLQEQQSILQTNLLPLAKETFDASRISYESGGATILDLLDAQRTYIHVREELLKVQRDSWISLATLERQVGGVIYYPTNVEAQS